MFNHIRASLTLWYVGVLLVIVVVIAGVTYLLLYRSLTSEVDDSLQDSARQIGAQLDSEALERLTSGRPGEDHEEEEHAEDEEGGLRFFGATGGDTFYLVLDGLGRPLLDPLNVQIEGVPDASGAAAAAARGTSWRTISEGGVEYRLFSRAIREDGETIAIVQVGRSLEEHQGQLQTLLIVLLATGGAGLLLAAAGGTYVSGRALRPAREAFRRQRAFVADASHELRTPLTLLRGNAELLQASRTARLSGDDAALLDEVIRQTAQIERLIGDLSTLARMDEGQLALQVAPLDLGGLLDEVARSGRLLGRDKSLTVQTATSGDLILAADEVRLRELLLSLVDNAVRHTPPGGHIDLAATGSPTGVEVSVADTGPGIPSAARERIFERFYRVDAARSRDEGGSGLGLAIARAIAEAHGGSLEATDRAGGGAVFVLRLPRTPPAAP